VTFDKIPWMMVTVLLVASLVIYFTGVALMKYWPRFVAYMESRRRRVREQTNRDTPRPLPNRRLYVPHEEIPVIPQNTRPTPQQWPPFARSKAKKKPQVMSDKPLFLSNQQAAILHHALLAIRGMDDSALAALFKIRGKDVRSKAASVREDLDEVHRTILASGCVHDHAAEKLDALVDLNIMSEEQALQALEKNKRDLDEIRAAIGRPQQQTVSQVPIVAPTPEPQPDNQKSLDAALMSRSQGSDEPEED
jgi:hypothetical protein